MPQIFTFTVSDPEGMHARPAGRLVAKAQEYESSITVATVENPWMPSVSSVLWDLMFNKVTRLRFGCRATMKLSLLQSSSDSSRSTCNENDTGVSVSAGIAIGTVRVLAAVDYAVERRLIDDPQAEMDRFRAPVTRPSLSSSNCVTTSPLSSAKTRPNCSTPIGLCSRTRTMRNASKV